MKCIVCGSTNISKIHLIHEVSRYTKTAYPLWKCINCGLVRPNPLPYNDREKLSIYDVPENIKFYDKEKREINRKSYEYKYYFKHFKPYIDLVRRYKIRGKAIDIGCGAGHLLKMLSDNGLEAEGIEISPVLIKALKKDFKVYDYELGDKRIKNRYNLATLNQVIEHINNPEDFIRKINNLLVVGGYIILATPYLRGIIPQILRTKWYGLGYGQHLNFFSKKSLKILFERNGFEICEFNVLIVDYAHPKFPKIINFIANFLSKIIVLLKLGDNLFLVARKIDKAKGEEK